MKNLFITSILLFMPLFILSQEIDEAFLESLPEDVRKEVEEKAKIQSELDKPVYRRASTMTDKEKEEEEEKNKDKLKIFGKDIFDMMQSSFMPVNEPNVNESYTLDFGDVLQIQIVGQKNLIEQYPLQRDGSINIPDLGKIFLAGLSLSSAEELIKVKVKEAFVGTDSFTTLINIRDIQVLVSGNAFNPGIYVLGGNSSPLHALSMAGGINEFGSYREIQVIRNNEVISEIDLYDLFIYGKTDYGLRLKSGDSVFVLPKKNIINIASGVYRPMLYELKDGEDLSNLINFANGFRDNAMKDEISIQRIEGPKIKLINDEYDELNKFKLENGDVVVIPEYNFGTVKLTGAVNIPGYYTITENYKLGELILRAGGYKSNAYPFSGFLNNKKALEINTSSRDILYKQFIRDFASNPISNANSDATTFSMILDEMKNADVSGRVMAEFDLDVINSYPDMDTLLEDGDEIIIPFMTNQVYVYGEVSTQGSVRYSSGKSVNYYIKNSGGILDTADYDSVFVVHPNGATERISINNSRFSFLNRNNDINIYPGSIIYVPKDALLRDGTQIAAVWAPIISSLALSITSLSVLESN